MDNFLLEFIYAESIILIPVLYLIGLFLSRTPKVPTWMIPWVQVLIGVVFCLAYYGLIIQAVVQGILVAGAATLVKDLFHRGNYLPKNSNKQ